MAHRWRYGQRRRLLRCDGCRQHEDESIIRAVHRLHAAGELQLCPGCWRDLQLACRFGGHDLGDLLEQLAASSPAAAGAGAGGVGGRVYASGS